jgi:hypothetical protein
VPTYGRGPGAEKLRGVYSNTHLYSVMAECSKRVRKLSALGFDVATEGVGLDVSVRVAADVQEGSSTLVSRRDAYL